MKQGLKFAGMFSALLLAASAGAAELAQQTFGRLVDGQGGIRIPQAYRSSWTHLGSWVVDKEGAPGQGFHDVYAQPEAVQAYRRGGSFPDGTVLVKEIRAIEAGDRTTGPARWAGGVNIWFVMVRDTEGRFKGSPHWAQGWGWALFEARDPAKNVSKGFEASCKGCHLPAKDTGWVYVEGYPTLKKP